MIDIAVQDLNKYYGSNHVLKGISLEIIKGEKVGLIGKNGSGKTTLFKILSDMETYESGNVIKASNKRIEVLEQVPSYEDNYTAEDVLRTAFDEIYAIYGELKRMEDLIKVSNCDKLLTKYGKFQTEFEAMGGYDCENKIDKICMGMNISDNMRIQLFSNLSEGEKTRVNLARILLRDCDILLLDEPTNHLDLASIQWVEEFLKGFTGTVVIISHDRYFLDNVVNKMIEIEDGKLNFYEGSYSFYVKEKEERFSLQSEKYVQQQRKIEHLEVAAKRMHEWAKNADSAAMHRRAFSIEKRIERIDRVEKPVVTKKITAEFKESKFSSGEMAAFKDISKSFEAKLLFSEINLKIRRNDVIAIIGDNGCGKSTLIKLLIGEEQPQDGEVIIGNSAKILYMPQVIEFDDKEASILETIRYELEINEEKARKILATFHFRGSDVSKKTGMLSGGEKSRLKMCILMSGECNFLVLDEPTNHLDIASREWIEDAVSLFKGTILFISHDRYFINKFATRIWDMRDAKINDFCGNFKEYSEWSKEISNIKLKLNKKNSARKPSNSRSKEFCVENSILKKGQEFENEILDVENRIKSISKDMDMFSNDFDKLNILYLEKAELEKNLDSLYREWEMYCNG